MKKFETPVIKAIAFEVADVVTASGYDAGDGGFGGDEM